MSTSAAFFAESLKSRTNQKPESANDRAIRVLIDLNLTKPNVRDSFSKSLITIDKLRWIEIFLDNYILELDVDSAIAIYNELKGKIKALDVDIEELKNEAIINSLFNKFENIRKELVKRREWLNEQMRKRNLDSSTNQPSE